MIKSNHAIATYYHKVINNKNCQKKTTTKRYNDKVENPNFSINGEKIWVNGHLGS